MINNYDTISNLLKFPTPDSFYFVEILKRRKENPEMERHAEVIKDFYVTSSTGFQKQFNQMKDYCDKFNARAYFRLNVRDAKMIALQCNKRLAELLITQDWKGLKNMYASVVGEFHSDPDKTWVIDIDEPEDKFDIDFVAARIRGIYNEYGKKFSKCIPEKEEDCIVARIPTLNGIHLITKPFRLDVFKNEFPTVDVHKDNPTILYAP